MQSTDVKLPVAVMAQFPSSCVVCGAEHPNSKITLSDNAAGMLSSWFFHSFLWSAKVKVEAPACRHCASSYRWVRLAYNMGTFVSIAVGVAAAIWLIPATWSRLFKKAAFFAIAIVCLIPYGIWVVFNPLPFHIYADETSVSYQFKNHEYAKAFAILNETSIDE
jgi:hypothetical protein